MRYCEVVGCSNSRARVFDLTSPEDPAMGAAVCLPHLKALTDGELDLVKFETGEPGLELSRPPEVVSAKLTQSGRADSVLRLGLGEAGIESTSVDVRYNRATVDRLLDILAFAGDLPSAP